jgi:ferredoxin--NADP+ reductase
MDLGNYHVAVIGAGPAGIFASRELAQNGVQVFLFNRDIKPGGLAEYGIYPDKHRMKAGLRSQFESIINLENVTYFGNVNIGTNGLYTLNDLRKLGVDAFCVTTGAQGTKWLGLPGEELTGVFHAKDLVYHYNSLPPFSTQKYHIGRNVAIVGVGNVMMDIARYLITEKQVDTITAIARRGPGELKFSKKELEYIGQNLDTKEFLQELERATPLMQSLGQDPADTLKFVDDALKNADVKISDTVLKFRFLSSIKCIHGDENGQVTSVELEENTLVNEGGWIRTKGLGIRSFLDIDTVIFAIGDAVDPGFGLPVDRNEFVKNPEPRFAVEGNSFECFDPHQSKVIDDVFLAGWARKASNGLVGVARKDGVHVARAVMSYLETVPSKSPLSTSEMIRIIRDSDIHIVDKNDLKALKEEEERIALKRNIPSFKFSTNAEMLSVIEAKKIMM